MIIYYLFLLDTESMPLSSIYSHCFPFNLGKWNPHIDVRVRVLTHFYKHEYRATRGLSKTTDSKPVYARGTGGIGRF